MTKAEIKNKFKPLKQWGYTLKNFEHYKPMPKGSKGFIDLFVITPDGWTLFIDIKSKNDRPSEDQLKFRDALAHCKYAVHFFATEDNVDRMIEVILQKKYNLIRENEMYDQQIQRIKDRLLQKKTAGSR